MKSFLKNYTSEVPVDQTAHRIEQVLVRCGVKGITKEYATDQSIAALRFCIPGPSADIHIRLPVNVAQAHHALWMEYAGDDKLSDDGQRIRWNARKQKCKADFLDQARRTAWRLMQDWVEVQMSLIVMKQCDTLQIFLPYVLMEDGQTTLYHRIQATGFKALLPETTTP